MFGPGADRKRKRAFLEKLIHEHPSSGEVWLEYARFLDREYYAPQRASRAYEEAQRLLPDREDLSLLRGSALIEAGETKQGMKLILERLRTAPSSHGYCLLAGVLLDREKPLTAARLLKRAISLDPDFEEPYYLMGRALKDASRQPEAIDYFRQALQRDKDYQLAWQQLGVALLHNQNTRSEGIEALHRAVALDPHDAWSLVYLGYGISQMGGIREAVPYYRKAHELYPDEPDFRELYEDVLAQSKVS